MKKIVVFILLQIIWTSGFSQNLRFKNFGTHIPARANLDVRWNAPTNALPPNIWVYHLLPRKLSAEAISNLMAACSFTEKDKTDNGDLLIFKSSDGLRRLQVCFSLGTIDYETTTHYSPTNLADDVPSEKQAIELMKSFLPKLGINLADVQKNTNAEPDFHVFEIGTSYFVNRNEIKNLEARGVRFGRIVDGIPFISVGTGGDGEIHFGEHGRISKIDLSWRNLERSKSYPITTPQMMIQSIRTGKAVQGGIPWDSRGIYWPAVKSVTIKELRPSYYAGDPLASSDWLYPFAALWTRVDTGSSQIDVEIDCPIINVR